MPATELELTDSESEPESERVERWRALVLEKVGYNPISVIELAARTDIDLHDAVRLIENGCPPETAIRILL